MASLSVGKTTPWSVIVDVYARHVLLRRAMRHFEHAVDEPLKAKLKKKLADDWLDRPKKICPTMIDFVKEEVIWDTYVIVQVINGCVDLFDIGEEAQLKDLAATAEQARVFRNEGSHGAPLGLQQVVGFMRQLHILMTILCVSPPSDFDDAWHEAKELVDDPCDGRAVTISGAEALELVLALALEDWEKSVRLIKQECRKRSEHEMNPWRDAQSMVTHMKSCQSCICGCKLDDLNAIAGSRKDRKANELRLSLRHLLVHGLGERFAQSHSPQLDAKYLVSLVCVLKTIGFFKRQSDALVVWKEHQARAEQAAAGNVALVLRAADGPQLPHVPFALPRWGVVARDKEVEKLIQELQTDGAHVCIGGMPGVGKDTCAVAVLHDKRVLDHVLQPFMPFWVQATTADTMRVKLQQLGVDHLGAKATDDQQKVLAHVKGWLKSNHGWLLYVEDCGSNAASELLWLLPEEKRGRLLITSAQKLEELELSLTAPRVELGPFETTDKSLELLKKMGLKLSEDEERKLRPFLDEQLGNLPLSVTLAWKLMKTMSVDELIKNYNTVMKLEDVDKQGRSQQQGRHAIGLMGSVRLLLRTLDAEPAHERVAARALLIVLSVLPRASPRELFRCAPGDLERTHQSYTPMDKSFYPIFTSSGFALALEQLCRIGLVQNPSSAAGLSVAAITHQAIQRCVREDSIKATRDEAKALRVLVQIVNSKFLDWSGRFQEEHPYFDRLNDLHSLGLVVHGILVQHAAFVSPYLREQPEVCTTQLLLTLAEFCVDEVGWTESVGLMLDAIDKLAPGHRQIEFYLSKLASLLKKPIVEGLKSNLSPYAEGLCMQAAEEIERTILLLLRPQCAKYIDLELAAIYNLLTTLAIRGKHAEMDALLARYQQEYARLLQERVGSAHNDVRWVESTPDYFTERCSIESTPDCAGATIHYFRVWLDSFLETHGVEEAVRLHRATCRYQYLEEELSHDEFERVPDREDKWRELWIFSHKYPAIARGHSRFGLIVPDEFQSESFGKIQVSLPVTQLWSDFDDVEDFDLCSWIQRVRFQQKVDVHVHWANPWSRQLTRAASESDLSLQAEHLSLQAEHSTALAERVMATAERLCRRELQLHVAAHRRIVSPSLFSSVMIYGCPLAVHLQRHLGIFVSLLPAVGRYHVRLFGSDMIVSVTRDNIFRPDSRFSAGPIAAHTRHCEAEGAAIELPLPVPIARQVRA